MRDEWFLEMVHFQLLCTGYNEEWHDYIDYYDNVCYRQLWAVFKELGTCMKRARIVSEGKKGLEKAERILKGKGREHGHSQIGKMPREMLLSVESVLFSSSIMGSWSEKEVL